MSSKATIESGHRHISGRFTLDAGGPNGEMTFIWDGAALTADGSIVLIEDELTSINPLHIQGHLARAALMDASDESISHIIWVVRKEKFDRLWTIVESWRDIVSERLGIETPPCEYQTPEGERLMVSRDFN